jgi:nitrogen fixation NifU-like protein
MSELDQKLLDHFLNPRNVGVIENPSGFGRALNPVNQYLTDMYLQVKDGRIEDIKFKTFGCVVTIASASALTTKVKGKILGEIVDHQDSLKILLELIHQELGVVPENNWHCPPAAVQALLVAFCDYYQKINDERRVRQVEKTLKDVQCYFQDGKRKMNVTKK